jgi:hypothetical protein
MRQWRDDLKRDWNQLDEAWAILGRKIINALRIEWMVQKLAQGIAWYEQKSARVVHWLLRRPLRLTPLD